MGYDRLREWSLRQLADSFQRTKHYIEERLSFTINYSRGLTYSTLLIKLACAEYSFESKRAIGWSVTWLEIYPQRVSWGIENRWASMGTKPANHFACIKCTIADLQHVTVEKSTARFIAAFTKMKSVKRYFNPFSNRRDNLPGTRNTRWVWVGKVGTPYSSSKDTA